MSYTAFCWLRIKTMKKQNAPYSFMRVCEQWLSRLSRTLVFCSLLALGVMSVLIAVQVASRNFMNIGLPWADELARLTGLMVVFFTIPYLQFHGRHISVDMLSNRLKGKSRLVLQCINEMAVLAFMILLVVSFISYLQQAGHFSTPATGMPNWIFYGPAFIGIISCTLVTALRLGIFCCGKSMMNAPTVLEGQGGLRRGSDESTSGISLL